MIVWAKVKKRTNSSGPFHAWDEDQGLCVHAKAGVRSIHFRDVSEPGEPA